MNGVTDDRETPWKEVMEGWKAGRLEDYSNKHSTPDWLIPRMHQSELSVRRGEPAWRPDYTGRMQTV